MRDRARATDAPVIVSGHSAGGHLAACMLATEAHVPAAYAISGLFELAPLIPTSLNEKLGLDEAEAEALSPLFWPAPEGKMLDAVVGGDESSEFLRQSAAIVARLGRGRRRRRATKKSKAPTTSRDRAARRSQPQRCASG